MKNKTTKQELGLYEGTGNVFEDLNVPDAAEHDLKSQLAFLLNEAIRSHSCSQAEIAKKLGLKQPHVSQLTNYKLQGFSVERLMQFIVRLGHSLTIQVSDKKSEDACVSVVTRLEESVVETAAFVGEVYDVGAISWYAGAGCVLHDATRLSEHRSSHFAQDDDYARETPIRRISASFAQAQRVRLQ